MAKVAECEIADAGRAKRCDGARKTVLVDMIVRAGVQDRADRRPAADPLPECV